MKYVRIHSVNAFEISIGHFKMYDINVPFSFHLLHFTFLITYVSYAIWHRCLICLTFFCAFSSSPQTIHWYSVRVRRSLLSFSQNNTFEYSLEYNCNVCSIIYLSDSVHLAAHAIRNNNNNKFCMACSCYRCYVVFVRLCIASQVCQIQMPLSFY